MAPSVAVDLPPSSLLAIPVKASCATAYSVTGQELLDLENSINNELKNTGENLAHSYIGDGDETIAMPKNIVGEILVQFVDGGEKEFIPVDKD